jgi:hypothetical protein
MDKTLYLIGALFVAAGIILGAVSSYFYNATQSFIDRAETVQGEVIELERSRSSSDPSVVFYPIVRFSPATGQQRTFRSPVGSSPPAYAVGESVSILYDRTNPDDARIDSFWFLWLLPTITGGIGIVFFLVGGGLLIGRLLMARRARNVRAHGTPVETTFQGVELNGAVRVNGRSPWRIRSQWSDPGSNTVYRFHSEDIWFDPTPFIKTRTITVYIEPTNPKHHYMDISFLPKSAA